MAGEMSQAEVTREAYPLHFAIADEFNGEVRAFDQYQGPYVRCDVGKFWIQTDDGQWLQVYNERSEKLSNKFLDDSCNGEMLVVEAARETLAESALRPYEVKWCERSACSAIVYADSEEEALERVQSNPGIADASPEFIEIIDGSMTAALKQ